MLTVNKFMKDARKNAGLTQAQIARKLGVHVQVVSNIERGASPLSVKHIRTMVRSYWGSFGSRKFARNIIINGLTEEYKLKISQDI